MSSSISPLQKILFISKIMKFVRFSSIDCVIPSIDPKRKSVPREYEMLVGNRYTWKIGIPLRYVEPETVLLVIIPFSHINSGFREWVVDGYCSDFFATSKGHCVFESLRHLPSFEFIVLFQYLLQSFFYYKFGRKRSVCSFDGARNTVVRRIPNKPRSEHIQNWIPWLFEFIFIPFYEKVLGKMPWVLITKQVIPNVEKNRRPRMIQSPLSVDITMRSCLELCCRTEETDAALFEILLRRCYLEEKKNTLNQRQLKISGRFPSSRFESRFGLVTKHLLLCLLKILWVVPDNRKQVDDVEKGLEIVKIVAGALKTHLSGDIEFFTNRTNCERVFQLHPFTSRSELSMFKTMIGGIFEKLKSESNFEVFLHEYQKQFDEMMKAEIDEMN